MGNPMFMLILMFLVIYLLMIRPQQKKAKEHRDFLERLSRGDQIITSSGMLGRVVEISDAIVTIEIAKEVRIRLLKSQIAGPQQAANPQMTDNGGKARKG